MDQFISLLARPGHALFLDCRPAADGSGYHVEQVPIPPNYALVVADSGVRHKNTGPLFNRRVVEGRIGVRLLQRRYPGITHLRDADHLPWDEIEPLLPEVIHSADLRKAGIDPETLLDDGLGPQTDTFFVRKRCRHVITENNRVLRSIAALSSGDLGAFGRLMREAHISARDDYEISAPEIETLVDLANAAPGAIGARLTGAGWGGCIVSLVRQDCTDAFTKAVRRGYRQRTGLETQVFVCRSSAGAGQVLRTRV